MSLTRKIVNGLLLVSFLAIIGGMIAWGIISHNDHKQIARSGRRAEERLTQDDELNNTNLGLIKG